ncbi:MAG: adenine deaminase [Spirochaetales bacterium]|nr:MAG: adenine deaminase [Spirochaetales bacterium]
MIQYISSLIHVASGREPADLLVKNGRFLDVFSGELVEGDMAVYQGRIAALGPSGRYRGKTEHDVQGRLVVPGLIDAHVHIESSLHGPAGFASLTVPRGTTTVVADPHEIANVCGLDGIRWILDASENVPLSVFVMLPSCVPATAFEDAGAVLKAENLAELIDHPRVLGLGEVMDYPAVAAADESMVAKIAMAREHGKHVDGHSPGLCGIQLTAYSAAGIGTDHECAAAQEMKERLQLGMKILIREGTAARDLAALIPEVNSRTARRCAFCTDDKLPNDIMKEGHIDFNIRKAAGMGFDPVEAVRLATLNAAETYNLNDRGALAPGRRADFVVLEGELADFRALEVFQGGEPVARKGKLLKALPQCDNSPVLDTVKTAALKRDKLNLHIPKGRARVIKMTAGSLLTGALELDVPTDDNGFFVPDPGRDLLKLVVVERHRASGLTGVGIVQGYGLKNGAAASSIAHDSHNLIAVGDDDDAILAALESLRACGGGISVAAKGGKSLGTLPLPLGGLMSDTPAEETVRKLEELSVLAHEHLGVRGELDPFMPLSFLALPVIPDLKLTARGLFDVRTFQFVPVAV